MQSELKESDLEDYGNPQGKIQGKVFFFKYNGNVAAQKYNSKSK